jgi:hypothetical protein
LALWPVWLVRADEPRREVRELSEHYVYNDGGRAEAGFKGTTGDCVTRTIAIAAELPYKQVYDDLSARTKADPKSRRRRTKANPYGAKMVSAIYGVNKRVYKPYLDELGWKWTPTMQIGSGCQVHLTPEELPSGRIIVRLSRHLCAVVDGIVHDTHDPSRDGTRCVYGYWSK